MLGKDLAAKRLLLQSYRLIARYFIHSSLHLCKEPCCCITMHIRHTACIAHLLILVLSVCSHVSCASINEHVYIQQLYSAHVCAGSGSRQEYTSPPSAAAPNIRGCHPGNIDYGTVHALKKLTFYGRTKPTATGVLRSRLRAYYAYGYGRTTPTVTGVLGLRLRAYLV